MLHPYSIPEKQRERDFASATQIKACLSKVLPSIVKSLRREVTLIQGASAYLNAVNMCKSLLLYCSTF